jgi:hypothetical protein
MYPEAPDLSDAGVDAVDSTPLCGIHQHPTPSLGILHIDKADVWHLGLEWVVDQKAVDPMTPRQDGQLAAVITVRHKIREHTNNRPAPQMTANL